MAKRNRGLIGAPAVQGTFDGINTTTGFMLVDLSDTTNWDHNATGHINVHALDIDIDATSAISADVYWGYLSSTNSTDATVNVIKHIPITQERARIDVHSNWYPGSINCLAGKHFGQTLTSRTEFNTGASLLGPSGATSHPGGDGDLVAIAIVTAGTMDISQTLVYHTEP
jgi:hypothetical protein